MIIHSAVCDFKKRCIAIWVDNVSTKEDFDWLLAIIYASQSELEAVYKKPAEEKREEN